MIQYHDKLMETMSCTANKSVPKCMTYNCERWHCIAVLMVLWDQEQHSNVVILLPVYTAPHPSEWNYKVWGLIDPLECNTDSNKRIELTGR